MMHDGWSGMMSETGFYWLVAGLIVVVVIFAWGRARKRSRDGSQPPHCSGAAAGVAISRGRCHPPA